MSTTDHWTIYDSPIGPLTLVGGPAGLCALRFPEDGGPLDERDHDPALFAGAVRQLSEYFAGRRGDFDLELHLAGTPFQRSVWEALRRIPCGATTTYAALARAVGRPDAVRAVGAAVGRTPVPIIVPCHRALGSDGSLTGYRGGLPRKRALLDLERRAAAMPPACGAPPAPASGPAARAEPLPSGGLPAMASGPAARAEPLPSGGLPATAAGPAARAEPLPSGDLPFSLPQLALL
jgi:methylated-DNA-[protein]-cysteine S-methyltransferase